ncbi:MAG: hypothetical protein J6V72_11105 [Kiritimatiellae bacterium]|nr:hypothetical protein [Kiritimatiellia bacterium]
MSRLKLLIKLVFGIGSAVSYALEVLNRAIAGIDPAKKEKIQHALNVAEQVLSVLQTLKFLCPTRWQTAYAKSVLAVQEVVFALADLAITEEEPKNIASDFDAAVIEWNGDDDETCV